MASEKDNKKREIVPLTAQEQSGLRRVYEAAGWKVSFHQGEEPFPEGFMRVKKEDYEEDISYEKIRQFGDALVVRRS